MVGIYLQHTNEVDHMEFTAGNVQKPRKTRIRLHNHLNVS